MPTATRGFRVPAEVPRYFADRDLKPAFSYLDVWGEEHARSFTVAKAVELDLLNALFTGLQKAIEGGQSYEAWHNDLKPNLERLGWWGKRSVADPENIDKPRLVDFSAPRRLQTIFWSNMRAARAAGQWERAQRTKRALPYLLYVRTTSADPRREHLGWVGTILPVDHSFWRTHFPPNGWMCKCAVRQISAAEAARYGKMDGYSLEPPTIDMQPFVNRRTGEVTYVPVGIDPGWHTNPGQARSRWRATDDAFIRAAEQLVAPDASTSASIAPGAAVASAGMLRALRLTALRTTVRARLDSHDFAAFHGSAVAKYEQRQAAKASVKAAGATKAAQDAAENAYPWSIVPALPIAVMPERLTEIWGDAGKIVTITDAGLAHNYDAHPLTADDWRLFPHVLEGGETYVSDAGDRIWAIRTIKWRTWLAVLIRKGGAWRVLTFFDPPSTAYIARQRSADNRRKVAEEIEG